MTWGGKRNGAGRPLEGPRKELTKIIRVPISIEDDVENLKEIKSYKIPVFSSKVPAGNPSPADNHIDKYVNAFKLLFPNPKNMGLVPASGDSMIDIGINDGMQLITHFKQAPKHKDIVIGMINGEQTVKQLLMEKGEIILQPKNENYKPTKITPDMDFKIIGVVLNWLGKPLK